MFFNVFIKQHTHTLTMSNTLSLDEINTTDTTSIDKTQDLDALKRIAAEVLGIENSAAWGIVSTDGDLVMIHHKPEADLLKYGDIRGLVIDTKTKTLVCKSYGYTPIVKTDGMIHADNKLKLGDENGNSHFIDLNDPSNHFKVGFEGPLINVFKHNGMVYRSTRKRLDPLRSRWGNSRSFLQMYWELDGPNDDELFDSTKDYSPYCHSFILVHPEVLVASKVPTEEGFLVYLGATKMDWVEREEFCPYPLDQVEMVAKTPPIQPLGTMTLEQANHHLEQGFYTIDNMEDIDPRLMPGEFVILHTPTQLLRIQSTPYTWRLEMRDNNPNLYHRFCQLITHSYQESSHQNYPVVTPYDMRSIRENIKISPYVVWPQDSSVIVDFSDRDERTKNIWLCFLNSVPLNRQKEVVTFFDKLYRDRAELIGWLRTLGTINKLESTDYSKRVINIVETAHKFAQGNKDRGKNFDRQGKMLTLKKMVDDNIRNLVMKEEGGSLYRLIKEMNEKKTPKV
jgi:hypothetical protein